MMTTGFLIGLLVGLLVSVGINHAPVVEDTPAQNNARIGTLLATLRRAFPGGAP